MIIEKRNLFFRSATIILEDEKILEFFKSGRYSSIVALSYHQLDLPGFVVTSKPTLLIPLQKSEEEIFRNFNDTTRNEIRKAERIPELEVVRKEMPDDVSYALYRKFEYSQGRVPVNREVVKHSIFWGAYYNGELISGIYVTQSRPYLRVRSIFSERLGTDDKERYKLIGYSTRRLVWEICVWGTHEHFVSLDLASVNINNPKTESIARFKMSFGKQLTTEYLYTYKSKLFAALEKIVLVKLFLRRMTYRIKKLFS